MVEIREVRTKKEMKLFVEFPNILYRGHPYYTPFLLLDEYMNLSPKTNPAYEFCEVKLFLAFIDGKVVGRLGTILNHAHNDKFNQKRLRFTRFDVIDNLEVTRSLFASAIAWAKEKGLTELMGPIGFCDLDKQGLLVEGFEELNMFITLYNHPYYATHLDTLGFLKEADWVEYQVFTPQEIDPRLEKISEALMKRRGFKLLKFTSKRQVKPYIYKVFDVVNEAFAPLYGVIPLTQKQIDMYVKQFIGLLNFDYLTVIVNSQDDVVGFGLSMPSFSKAIQKAKGRLLPWGWFHLLKAMKHHDVIDLYLIGVRPEYQGLGLNSFMLLDTIKAAKKNGVRYAETGPELENNEKVQSQWKGFEVRQHRRRRCYVKKITDSN